MKKSLHFVLILFLCSCAATRRLYQPPKRMVAARPVVNVRSEPLPHPGRYEFDHLQQTQLERGEPVLVYERDGDWLRIEAPEQMEYTQNSRWEGYPGWVPRQALTTDMAQIHDLQRLNIPTEELRKMVLEQARLHVGDPYLWGGRSKHDPRITDTATGVDCSGLVNWSFRQVGWFVPRDAHEQYMRARIVHPKDLEPGDLIFLAKADTPDKTVHVSFYSGEEKILEAPQTGEAVREISFKEKFGIERNEAENGMTAGDRVLNCGTFFPEE